MQDFFIATTDKLTKLTKDGTASDADCDGIFYTSEKEAQNNAPTGSLIYKIQATYLGKVEPYNDDNEDYCQSCGYEYWECEC